MMKKYICILSFFLFFSSVSYGNFCKKNESVIEKFTYHSVYKNKNLEVCVYITNDDNYILSILNDEKEVILQNLTKNLSTKVQDISINPSENGFTLVFNIGENYTKTINLKFAIQDTIKLDEISTYISRNSKMIEEYKKIVYQYDNTKIEDLDLEKILNDEF